MYSQNSEEAYIVNYFKSKNIIGTFLDCGAYDGVDLSNTRALAEQGWSGICVEPMSKAFEKLCLNYKENKNVYCYEVALGLVNGIFHFNENDTYYSTISDAETKRWVSDSTIKFKKKEVEVLDFDTFLKQSHFKKFDFISIDCEGVDYDILTQMDLKALECKMICVEHNSVDTKKYIDYIEKFGFKTVHINPENLLMAL